MKWYVIVETSVRERFKFEFQEFPQAIQFIDLWQQSWCGLKCNYKLIRNDI